MRDQIKLFLIEKGCQDYQINNEPIVCSVTPSEYYYIEYIDGCWQCGISSRGYKIKGTKYLTEESALLWLVYKRYTVGIINKMKLPFVMDLKAMTPKELHEYTLSIFDDTLISRLQIVNNKQLLYNNEYFLKNLYRDKYIEEFYFYKLFALKGYELTKLELIRFGIDPVLLEDSFRFELLQ